MKKLLLFVLLVIGTAAYAQVEKGDFTGTANVSFQSVKPEGGDAINLSTITVRGGYFFTNNIEGGLSILVSGTSFGGESSTATGFGPYAVYNFLTADAKLLPYLGANFFSYNTGEEGVDPINQIGAFGGAKYFLTEVVNVDASLNYTSWLGDISGSSLLFNVGIGINFGRLK